jgi:hypothetical protein
MSSVAVCRQVLERVQRHLQRKLDKLESIVVAKVLRSCAKESELLKLSFNSTGVLVRSSLSFIQNFPCSVSFGCIHGDGVEVWMQNILYWFIGTKLSLAPLSMPKWVWPSLNWCTMFFVQTSTLTPSMNLELTEHGKYRIQINQLPTKLWLN